ncbi:hypothetical protein [Micromonospora wenchangensis]|uniref:hypothetical protein n=1 Tax=Micromonospora wenchangensis TaxID=1185415 RepID=UPI003816F614
MSNLPFTLPHCTDPATERLEVYSPADGRLHGSLDAIGYICDRHGAEAVSVAESANLAAYRTPMCPDGVRTCGQALVFAVSAGGAR